MAVVVIQHRRGSYTNFDPQYLRPGEWAIVQENDPNSPDGKAIYVCISSGVIKRIASVDELGDYDAQAEQALEDIRAIATNIDTQLAQVNTKASEAEQSASLANVAKQGAETAKQGAETAKDQTEQLASQAETTITTQTNIAIQRINDAADARAATIDTDGIIHL